MRIASHAKAQSVKQGSAISKTPTNPLQQIFAGLFGALLGLSLLKFGNPIIMEKFMDWPRNGYEWVLNPWPVVIGYWLLGGVAVLGLVVARWKINAPGWLVAMPLLWLAWQWIAMTHTVSMELSKPTVLHFATCVVCFYLGLFSLGRVGRLMPFWIGLMAGLFFVVVSGFEQHFGGLEDSRRYWMLYEYPRMAGMPGVDMLVKKMMSSRIFATLFYPNTLAGVILLLLPPILAVLWSCRERFTVGARSLLMSVTAVGTLACLFWSGSKGGWLLLLGIGIVASMYMAIPRQFKLLLVGAVLVLGLAGFFVKYAGFFRKGATSVVARFDYWEAALKTTKAKPVFGNGPGTFGKAYQSIKRPESEMALMTHNDYLEQASDSGLPGFITFGVFVVGSLIFSLRRGTNQKVEASTSDSLAPRGTSGERAGERGSLASKVYGKGAGNFNNAPGSKDWVKLAVWLGLLGWALQSFVEFGLYIPAVAWPAFGLLGWLLAQCGNEIDRKPAAS